MDTLISQYFTNEQASLYLNGFLAIAAWIALRQISIAKSTASNNSRRESIKFATDLVKNYLNDHIKTSNESYDFRKKNSIQYIELPPEVRLIKFTREEASKLVPTAIHSSAEKLSNEIWQKHENLSYLILNEQNSLEAIATPFIAGVADSETGFKSIGISFCNSVETLWFEYTSYRSNATESNYFSNTIALYDIWKSKLEKYKLEEQRKKLEREIAGLNDTDPPLIGV